MELRNLLFIGGLTVLATAGCTEADEPEALAGPMVEPAVEAAAPMTRVGRDATQLTATLANGGQGWAADDSISVYRFESMSQNSYHLVSGAGTPSAVFTRTAGTDDYGDAGRLFGLTNTRFVYSFSYYNDVLETAQVAISIPYRLGLADVGAPAGTSRTPVPCWAELQFGSDGRLTGDFHSLTALLRIDTSLLPEGTRAVVLTTRGGELGGEALPRGEQEPLSGMFDTLLGQGASLQANPIFVTRDTLRINLGTAPIGLERRYLYIPVIARSYEQLHVVAVTDDVRSAYTWQGTLLKTFGSGQQFRIDTVTDLDLTDTAIRPVRR